MNKKIIHFRIPFMSGKNSIVSQESFTKFLKFMKDGLGEDYLVCGTPFEAESGFYEKVLIDEITLKEFLEKYNIGE